MNEGDRLLWNECWEKRIAMTRREEEKEDVAVEVMELGLGKKGAMARREKEKEEVAMS